MPSADDIRVSLATIVNDWRSLAVAWHLALAVAMVSVFAGWRPSARVAAVLTSTPLLSVSILAWLSGNPFNGAVFAVIALMLLSIGVQLADRKLTPPARPELLCGLTFVAFGWAYPHFLVAESPVSYLYEAPFGLIPCPTLLVVTGVSIGAGVFQSRAWLAILAMAAMGYGLIGVFLLNVIIDLALIAAAGVLVWRGVPQSAAIGEISSPA